MNQLDQKAINTLRVLSAETVQKAKSGHPGLPLGAAPIAYTIWAKAMKHSPKNPNFVDRDRFILSAGHGSAMLYTMFHLFGYGLTMDDLKSFRQAGSLTPGHPEYGHTTGVEITTGPLGQGIANGVGMAMAEAHLAAKFNRPGHEIVDHYTYVLCGDGCLMEGVAAEAASLAGTLGLGKLILLYDSNSITIEGNTDIAFTEDVVARFDSYGWHTQSIEDGNDIDAIENAINAAKAVSDKPSLIKITTVIGYGSPKAGSASSHGEPLGDENIKILKENLGMPEDAFFVADDVKAYMDDLIANLNKNADNWDAAFAAYQSAYPELAAEWTEWMKGSADASKIDTPDFWQFEDKPAATRATSGTVLNRLAEIVPNLFGGSADLAPSNKSDMKGKGDFSKDDRAGQNLHFGVREHAMGAIMNAVAAHGGLIPYGATFFVFSDYVKPSMRLAALMGLPTTYIFTHDSIGVGEDGPTHQPIEQLSAMRAIPGFVDFRPADGKETAAGWLYAVTNGSHPVGLALTRQNLPQYAETGREALRGAYVLLDSKKETPDVILIASGSEVELVYKAHAELAAQGVDARVVSMPSMTLFEMQDAAYKESVLPCAVRARVAVEAGSSFGWDKYVGLDGKTLTIDSFGASAPAGTLFEKFGFTVQNVVDLAKSVL
ncbi:MAG: transketolase [Oscillospiraceae bacterium]|nr:transketolase [Oscillospiraceae bacterium]